MTTSALARINRGRLLRALAHSEPRSRAELAEETGLSVATVSRAVASLSALGLVTQSEAADPTGGRPRTLVAFGDGAATLVVDVADRHTEVAAISLTGETLERRLEEVEAGQDPEARLTHTLATIDAAVAAWPPGRRLLGLGVAVPGPVDESGVVEFAPAIGWREVPLGPLLRERLGIPVAVHNDANLIAVAESEFGAEPRPRSLVVLAVFDGVGSGIVVDGRLWEGATGASGQLGRMLLTLPAVRNVYEGFGDLESHLGTGAVAARALDVGIALDPAGDVWGQLLVELPPTDPRARELASDVLDEFAMALVNVCALIDPEAIILAGRFAPIADAVIPELHRRLTRRVLHVPRIFPQTTPVPGTLLGAALAAERAFGPLEQLLDTRG